MHRLITGCFFKKMRRVSREHVKIGRVKENRYRYIDLSIYTDKDTRMSSRDTFLSIYRFNSRNTRENMFHATFFEHVA